MNQYAYIIGEEELPKILKERYKKEVSEILDERLSDNEPTLINRIWKFFEWFLPEKEEETETESTSMIFSESESYDE